METILGGDELGEENQKLFDVIWKWFVDNHITGKERPQVMNDPGGSYHTDGLICIKEAHDNKIFPIGAVLVEEILHYVTSSDNEESSADFSPVFLEFIFRLIVARLGAEKRTRKRDGTDFQSLLIGHLWEIIQLETCHDTTARSPE